jgi:NTE family protein
LTFGVGMPAPTLFIRPAEASVSRRIALVLGGGGLKGFAHIGVLRALEERAIVPDVYGGTSIGALIAASYLSGTTVDELTGRA